MTGNPRFIMIGGFLGAGKTTTIAKLATYYRSQGLNIAIVTNDQASDLVDTFLLRSQGFHVGEVAGSCFCCNFDALTSTVESLSLDQRPDIVLAEPVGSCTDLVATVIRPLEQVYQQPFDIAPYGVIIKPSHGSKILGGEGQKGFSRKAEYIFRKQIEEADFVIINRIDELSQTEADRLRWQLEEQYAHTPILRMSAKTGEGFDDLCEFLERRGEFGRKVMEVDYQIYAEGEAELGWLNCQTQVTSLEAFDLDQYLVDLLAKLQLEFVNVEAEVAHLKAIGQSESAYAVANLVSNLSVPVLSLSSASKTCRAEMVVNARVATSPESLERLVRDAIAQQAQAIDARAEIRALQCFRPGKPVPTHRIN